MSQPRENRTLPDDIIYNVDRLKVIGVLQSISYDLRGANSVEQVGRHIASQIPGTFLGQAEVKRCDIVDISGCETFEYVGSESQFCIWVMRRSDGSRVIQYGQVK